MTVENTINVRAANPDNYLVPGRISLWVRDKDSSASADWKELGNIIDPSFEGTLTRLEHFSTRRGTRAKDMSIVTERSGTLSFSVDELNLHNLQFAFGSKAAIEDGTVTLKESKVLKNTGAAVLIAIGEDDIDLGSVIVRSDNLEDEDTFTVGVDYTVDEANGTITPTVAPGRLSDTTAYPTVHVYYERTVDTKKFTMLPDTEIEVSLQFQVLQKGATKMVITAANAVLKNNGAVAIGDGTDVVKIPMQAELLVDDNGDIATCHIPNVDEIEED
jgi:hypothetical protein